MDTRPSIDSGNHHQTFQLSFLKHHKEQLLSSMTHSKIRLHFITTIWLLTPQCKLFSKVTLRQVIISGRDTLPKILGLILWHNLLQPVTLQMLGQLIPASLVWVLLMMITLWLRWQLLEHSLKSSRPCWNCKPITLQVFMLSNFGFVENLGMSMSITNSIGKHLFLQNSGFQKQILAALSSGDQSLRKHGRRLLEVMRRMSAMLTM